MFYAGYAPYGIHARFEGHTYIEFVAFEKKCDRDKFVGLCDDWHDIEQKVWAVTRAEMVSEIGKNFCLYNDMIDGVDGLYKLALARGFKRGVYAVHEVRHGIDLQTGTLAEY